ncbi:uncharacterized protein LOC126662323 [Mercurialis annua]|uniref:uncharacterized protein LOC126662323 n=1 Tax=Mercurialis annua TaxID=3986 RepID=UPI00215E92B6|nr:uncharacterized protein LOC126662323 [Mercurialis annua]XP_055960191.1 uncharacterized protein LOC126662323 [Mercurialis annua]
MKQSRKCKRKSGERAASGEDNTASPRNTSKRRGSKRRNVGAQISNEEAPGITNGTEAGYKYGKTKKGTKTRLRKNSLVQQAQDDLTLNFVSVPVTVTDDNDTGKNGESCKSQPRRAESILEEIDGNNQSCSMFHPESSELRMIDYDGIGTIDSNNLASSQKICSKSGDEEQFLIIGFADIFMSSLDCPNSNLLEITNGHQDETVGQPDIQARSLH